MAAARLDITLEPGSGFELEFTWKDSNGVPTNLTGYTAQAQVRSGYSAALPALTFTVALGGSTGVVTVSADSTATEAVTIGRGVWDLELTPPTGDPIRILYGDVTVMAEVTRGTITPAPGLPPVSQPGAFITSGIATSFPPNVVTVMTFDTVIADNDGFWDPAHPTRLTVPWSGLYFIHGNIEFTANTGGARQVYFRKNGRTTGTDPDSVDLGHGEPYLVGPTPTDTPQVHAHCAAVLAAGDYVEMFGAAIGASTSIVNRVVRPNTPQFALFYQGSVS
jgi:hypothetical protein